MSSIHNDTAREARLLLPVCVIGVMLLIFIGIHNAWDIVTYLATGAGEDPPGN